MPFRHSWRFGFLLGLPAGRTGVVGNPSGDGLSGDPGSGSEGSAFSNLPVGRASDVRARALLAARCRQALSRRSQPIERGCGRASGSPFANRRERSVPPAPGRTDARHLMNGYRVVDPNLQALTVSWNPASEPYKRALEEYP